MGRISLFESVSNGLKEIIKKISQDDSLSCVYILENSDKEKYYVGSTSNPQSTLTKHTSPYYDRKNRWLSMHEPWEVFEIYPVPEEVTKEFTKITTLKLMNEKGWENVRGYAWSAWNLENPPVALR